MHYHRLIFPLITVLVFIPRISTAQPTDQMAEEALTKQKYRARIVDFGSDHGSGFYRDTPGTRHSEVKIDVDGDGSTSDDGVAFWKFSLDEPMNPSPIHYDIYAPSAIYFGGITGYFDKPDQQLTEGLINENHELRDDQNMMSVHSDVSLNKKAYGLWYWKKEHFLNGGNADSNHVSFDDESLIAVHISRYWSGIEGGRFIVSDNGRFYISEVIFDGIRTSHTLVPTRSRWTEYNPLEPYDIGFDADAANWENLTFEDVDAVGFYIFKDALNNVNVQVKWHSVEVWANIEREPTASFLLDMVSIPAGNFGGPLEDFYVSTTEVPYHTWHKVYKWAVSNQYCFDVADSRGYVFERDGDMGSMDHGEGPHTSLEPVTDISWLDAVLWCNALSEYEGYQPCYYADPNLTERLKAIRNRDNPWEYDQTHPVYVDFTANGYRLPTISEWSYAASEGTGSASADAAYAHTGMPATQEVGQLKPNNWGVYDAIGNVWEYTWDIPGATDMYAPDTDTLRIVTGGDFLSLTPPREAALRFGEYPFQGQYNIGFRVMRAENGTVPPAINDPGTLPVWEIRKDSVLHPSTPGEKTDTIAASKMVYLSGSHVFGSPADYFYEDDNLGYMRVDGAFVTITPFYASTTEINYHTWREIYNWAVLNGYTFDRDGDMGSMDWNVSQISHNGNEPVTDVGWNDAVVWCNALSEYEGLDPVYFKDTTGERQVLREANQWRLRMEHRPGYNVSTTTQFMTVIPDFSKNGYRLPTLAEWEIMARAGNENEYPGELPAADWYSSNSDDRTHNIGTSATNGFNIHDLGGNVEEWVWDWVKMDYYVSHNPKGSDDPDLLFGKGVKGSSFGGERTGINKTRKERESAARPYIGFRVVRCDSGEHPARDIFIPEVILEFDPGDYDLLDGQTFRNNLLRNGSYDVTGIQEGPVEIKWEYSTGGSVKSSPVMVGGTIYAGSNDGMVYAINAETGELEWKYNCGAAVTASPTIADSILYIGDHSGYFHAIYTYDDPSAAIVAGAAKWKVRAASDPIESTAAVFYGIAVTGWQGWSTNNKYIGFDTETGQEKWRYRGYRANGGFGGLTVDTFNIYAPVTDNMYMSASISTEITDWKSTGIHGYNFCPVINQDLVLYACENFIRASRRNDGSTAWTFYNGDNTDKHQFSSPAIGSIVSNGNNVDVVYYAQLNGTITCLRAITGEEVWRSSGFGAFLSSPSYADNRVFIGSDDGFIYAFNAGNGKVEWSWEVGSPVISSPLPSEGVICFGADNGMIYAIQKEGTFVNSPPTVDPLNDITLTADDSLQQSIALSGISDGNNGSQELTITASSSNIEVVDNVYVDYTAGSSNATLYFTLQKEEGTTTIEIILDDGQPVNNRTSISFNVTVGPSAIKRIPEKSLSIYPNPANSEIRIISDEEPIKRVFLTDMNGRILIMKRPMSRDFLLDLLDLASGTYYLKITSAEQVYHAKIIKSKH
ncbi:MAG: SUMF1/EgtB/PvdO family nonheme iron enzyme [Bacteroidales bacterium]|nr:SUMF1/EgtB/PvdO family nonheme iron enzyme [Bacteroidales bacterium]